MFDVLDKNIEVAVMEASEYGIKQVAWDERSGNYIIYW